MNVEKCKVMRISRQPLPLQFMVNQKQLENVEYFNYLARMIINGARCTREIKLRIATGKQNSTKRKLFLSENWTYV